MSADNIRLLFILVWTFVAVCQDDDDDFCSINCEDVTGFVGENVNLNCHVSWQCSECCILMYKFQHYGYSSICEHVSHICDRKSIFTCRYTPTAAVTEIVSFFIQTHCGMTRTYFSVDITERVNHETEAPGMKAPEINDCNEYLRMLKVQESVTDYGYWN